MKFESKVYVSFNLTDKWLELSHDPEIGGYDVLRDDQLVISTYANDCQAFARARKIFEEELASLLDEVGKKIGAADWQKQLAALKASARAAQGAIGAEQGQAPDPAEEFP